MQQYADTVLDANGNDLVGAQVLVQTGGVTASIYADNGITPQANPMTTDGAGRFAFYAADGTYALIVSDLQGHQTTVITTLLDSSSVSTAVNAATNAQASAVAAALSASQAASVGVPVGGTTNQVLAKASNADRDLKWSSAAGGAFSISGDVTAPNSTGVLAATVKGLNGVSLSSLSTGLLKNTAGVPSTAVAGTDYQAPLVSAANIKTINGNTLLGSGDLTISGGGTGSPGGSTTQVQYNDAGNFAGDATFTFNKATGAVGVSSLVSAGPVTGFNLSGTNTGDQDLSGLVTKTTTVNGHALSSNVTVTASDVGAQATLVSGTNIKTINSTSILGSGNLVIAGGGAGTTAIGYTTGAGGTVTQATSKSTGVTLNTLSGEITLTASGSVSANGGHIAFVLTNSTISATDLLILNHVSGGTIGAYCLNAVCAAGQATIYVSNMTSGSLAEAPVLRFALIKGATS